MLAASVMFSMTGVNKRRSSTRSRPTRRPTATGRQRRVGHRDDRQGGRAVLAVPAQAVQEGGRGGPDPGQPDHARRDVGHVTDQGDLTYLNLVHLARSTARTPTT
jgi:hypothetical protein